MSKKQKKMLTRIMAAAFGVILLNFVPVTGILRFTLYLAVYLVIGYDILKKAGRGILNRRMFDENFLMAVATIGAFALAVYSKSGDYTRGNRGNVVLSDRRVVPKLCSREKPQKYQCINGYPTGLCKCRM